MMVSTQVYVRLAAGDSEDDAMWRCYRTPDGKTPEDVGCSHRVPADANRHADELMLRGEGE